jgi:hypothetical protein
MLDGSSDDDLLLILEHGDDVLVGVLDVLALKVGDRVDESTCVVQGTRRHFLLGNNSSGNSDSVIVFTECRSLMNDTGTRTSLDVRVTNHSVRLVLVLFGKVVEQRRVPPALHIFSLEFANNLVLWLFRVLLLVGEFGKERADQFFQEDEASVSGEVLDLDVGEFGVDTERQVGGKRPRGCGPCQEGGFRIVDELECDGDCKGLVENDGVMVRLTSRIKDISVIITSLKVTQRSRASRRIRHHPQSSVDLSLLPQLTKHPPDTLHELGIHGDVTIFKVDPSAHLFNDMLPFPSVLQDNLSAFGIVLVDSHVHDVFLALDVEHLVNLVFDGQAVSIPSESSFNMVSRRIGVTRHHILDGTQEQVSVMRQTSGERRTIVESEFAISLALFEPLLAQLLTGLERIDGSPELQDLFVVGGKGDGLEGCDRVG